MQHDPRRPRPHASPINGWSHSWCGLDCPWHSQALPVKRFRRSSWRVLIRHHNLALLQEESELYSPIEARIRFQLREEQRMSTLRIVG